MDRQDSKFPIRGFIKLHVDKEKQECDYDTLLLNTSAIEAVAFNGSELAVMTANDIYYVKEKYEELVQLILNS